MDKFYLAKTIASDRKKEIDRDLKTQHMLKEAKGEFSRISKTRLLVMRFAPLVIIISIIVILIFI